MAKRLSKQNFIDFIVREATSAMFLGDARDGDAPPITLENFITEMMRHGAKALRTRLSQLSLAELSTEVLAALDYIDAQQKWRDDYIAQASRKEREELRQRLAPALHAKRKVSQKIDAAITPLVQKELSKRPSSTSHHVAVQIKPELDKQLAAAGITLKIDAIRKRVEKYRTHG